MFGNRGKSGTEFFKEVDLVMKRVNGGIFFLLFFVFLGQAVATPGTVGRWNVSSGLGIVGQGGSRYYDYALDIAIDSNGNVVVVTAAGQVLKYSANGLPVWSKRLNSESDYVDPDSGATRSYPYLNYILSGVAIGASDEIYVVGYRGLLSSAPNPGEEFVMRLSPGGSQVWYKAINQRSDIDDRIYWYPRLFRERNDWWPKVRIVPGTDTIIASSGDFFNGDEGQYDYTQLSISDGTIVKRWNQGCVAGWFMVTPDGLYTVDCSSYSIALKRIDSDLGSYLLNFDESFLTGQFTCALSPTGHVIAAAGSKLDNTRLSKYFFMAGGHLETRYQLDWEENWKRGYYINGDQWDGPHYTENRLTAIAAGPGNNIFGVGYLQVTDMNAYWVNHQNQCISLNDDSPYSYMTLQGYIAALSPDGVLKQEASYINEHRDAVFLAVAIDGSGNVVAAGYREDTIEIPFDNDTCRVPVIVPFVVASALKELPAYYFVRPSIQHRLHDPVDTVTGNYAEQSIDLFYPTPGIPLVLKRSYSSRFSGRLGSFGYGWSGSFDMHVAPSGLGYTVFWGDGHGDEFREANSTTTGQITQVTYAPVFSKTGYSLTEIIDNSTHEHYFKVYVPRLDRTIIFGHTRSNAQLGFWPTRIFKGKDQGAQGAFPLEVAYNSSNITIRDTSTGKATVLSTNDSGLVTRAQGPDGATWNYSYDENNDLVTVQRPDGTDINYQYNSEHHLLSITQAGKVLLQNSYDSIGRVVTQRDAKGHEIGFSYDDKERKTTVTSPDGTVTNYYYDLNHRLTKVADAFGHEKIYSYDLAGHISSIIMPDGSTASFSYDENGNLVSRTDPQGHTTSYSYDQDGHAVSVTDPMGNSLSFAYTDGLLTSWTNLLGGTYTLAYDGLKRLVSEEDPAGNQVAYSYDSSDLVSQTTRRDGKTISYTRDSAGRVTEMTVGSGSSSVSYTFDALGRETSIQSSLGTIRYTYNGLGYKATEQGVFGKTITYGYDGRSLSSIEAEGLNITTQRDEAGRPTQVQDSFGHTLTYSYDSQKRLTSITGPEGVEIDYHYDSANLVDVITYKKKGGQTFRTITLTRGAGGRIDGVNDDGAPSISTLPKDLNLTYDVMDRVSSYDYDPSGRLLSNNTADFEYNDLGRLKTITRGGNTTRLSYDGLGRLVEIEKGGDTKRVVYSGLVPLMELDSDLNPESYFIFGPGMSLALSGDGNVRYILLSDYRKNIIAVLDGQGEVVSSRFYSPYGTVLGEEGAWPVPFGFLGESGIFTREGLVLTRARAYDPDTARFLTPDPQRPSPVEPRSFNRYSYAYLDPLNLVDPSGLSPYSNGPRWLIPCTGWVIGCNVMPTLNPKITLDGIAYPPMNSSGGEMTLKEPITNVADATPIYSDRDSDNGGGNPQLAPNFTDASGLVATPIYSDRDSAPPPPVPQMASAPGDDYVAGISTVPIISLIG